MLPHAKRCSFDSRYFFPDFFKRQSYTVAIVHEIVFVITCNDFEIDIVTDEKPPTKREQKIQNPQVQKCAKQPLIFSLFDGFTRFSVREHPSESASVLQNVLENFNGSRAKIIKTTHVQL